jgi:cytosine/adenosine deaminase-related metal-dependent hydrolase
MPTTLVRNGTIVTMNDDWEIVDGDVLVRDGTIAEVGRTLQQADVTLDARGGYVLPGLVQTHIHLCQTLFRSFADDMPLLDWLRSRIWPLEAAHTPATLRAAARLAAAELLLSGTTTVLTMETVHDTDAVFEAVAGSGMRATIGKCMMDADAGVPARLREKTSASIDESIALHHRWHGAAGGRLRAAFAPRFAVSCSRALLEAVAVSSAAADLLVHTHASESQAEVALVRELSGGRSNVEYLADVGLATSRLCAAHCVWATEDEQRMMAERAVKVMHCPGSNLKLGSGIAPVAQMRELGICVSLGADGAACSNSLDMFGQMRLAATLQALKYGPGRLSARDVVWMETRGGARTLGLDESIGSIEPGKRADLIVLSRERPHMQPDQDPWSTLVYAAAGSDVRLVMVDGEVLVRDFQLTGIDSAEAAFEGRAAAATLASRAGLR